MRLNWDQGSLLKLIDVIGKTGRNWPIRDGKDQIKLIANSVKHAGHHSTSNGKAESTEPTDVLARSRGSSSNVTRDPHASLSLFAPREQAIEELMPEVVAPRASAKPPPRDYHDLFAGNESDQSPVTDTFQKSTNRERSQSPSKSIAPKAGAGKNYKPSRLFDQDENPADATPEKMYRPNPTKYQHFDFADGPGPENAAPPAVKDLKNKGKNGNKWDFEDFMTPEKPVPSKTIKSQEVRHWGNSDDEVNESPIRREKVDKPRKDAQTHFEFIDDGAPQNEKRMIGRPRGTGLDNGMGLYRNNVYDEEESESTAPAPTGNALQTVTNIKDRRKDFDPHFEMRDYSPVTKNFPGNANAFNDSSASLGNQKENINTFSDNENKTSAPLGLREGGAKSKKETGIVIAGDGMGGKKGSGRSWGFGEDGDDEESGRLNGGGGAYRKEMGGTGKKLGGTSQQTGGGDFWDF